MKKATLKDVKVRGQTVLVRVDYNVPLKDGKITDDLRIRASLPTLEYLRKKGARRIVLMSHLGRPDGKRVKELSLAPIAERLGELIDKVSFVDDVSGPDVEEAARRVPVGGILLLENLRFFPGEEKNSADFAKEIIDCTGADVFVQDGFAVIHRAHTSTSAIATELPSCAGLLLEKEISTLEKVTENPAHPFVVIIGGAKVEDKAPLIEKFSKMADKIIVGGKIAVDYAQDGVKIFGENSAIPKLIESGKVYIAEDTSDERKLDIGLKAQRKILEALEGAKTVLWNGVVGMVEEEPYERASRNIGRFLGQASERGEKIESVICGGDTTGFVEKLQKEDPKLKYSLVSTGGGAALSLLLGEELPGWETLDEVY